MTLEEVIAWFYNLALTYGYLGALVLSFLSNLILFVPIPYLIIVFWLSVPRPWGVGLDPTILGFISAFGATLGKLVVYHLGLGGRRLLSEEGRRRLEFARLIMDRYGAPAIFLFAVAPLPDDVLYIPLGMMGYSVSKFLLWCFLGKLILTLVITWCGYYSITWIVYVFGSEGSLWSMIITILFIVASIYITIKIDWEKIFFKYVSKRIKSSRKGEE